MRRSAVERKAPKRCALSPDDPTKPLESGMRSKRLLLHLYNKLFYDNTAFDILERQEDVSERQMDVSERRDGNGKDYGHRERPTEILGLQPILLYHL